MNLKIPFILLMALFLGCKSVETITPINSIQDVYIGGFDSVSKVSGKVWKNEDVLFSNEFERSSQILDIFISGKDVYAVGYQYNGNIPYYATLWKNGIPTILGDKKLYSFATSIFVSGNDVFVCGYQLAGNGFNSLIWKNGIPEIIAPNCTLLSIFVSGLDVYTCGTTGNYPNKGLSIFKNSKEIYFEKGAYPTGMFVSGKDVFVSGYTGGLGNDPFSPSFYWGWGTQAKLWKNGLSTILSDVQTGFSRANDVFVSGNDVYVVGDKYITQNGPSKGMLWKNGIATNLTNGTTIAKASSVYVTGNDVYVCGYEINQVGAYRSNGKIWKNGVPSVVSKTNNNLYPTSIIVSK
jgi:hypothetical protein